MSAVGVDRGQPGLRAEQPVYRTSGGDAVLDALLVEVAVVDGSVGKEGSPGQGGDHFREVEGHLPGVQAVVGADLRHVAVVAPAGQVALVVSWEAAKATAGDDTLDPLIE